MEEMMVLGGPTAKKKKKKSKKSKKSANTGIMIMDDEMNFHNEGVKELDKKKAQNQTNIMVEGQGMMSIDKDILQEQDDDDIKPVLVTDMSAAKIQEIISGQKEADIQKQRKKKIKESKKKAKKRESQWVEIDKEGNKVKALVGKNSHSYDFIESKEDRKERKKREKKDIRKEVKRKFLEQQAQKKIRKQELEEKLLGITPVSDEESKPKRRRHDTDSDSESDQESAPAKPKSMPTTKTDEMKAGLQSLDDLKKGIEENKKNMQLDEKDAFDQMKAQKTVYRDKDGRVITGDKMDDIMAHPKDKLRKLNEERLNMWSKGVVQTQQKLSQKEKEELKAAGDGEEYEQAVDQEEKQATRFGDPIAEIRKHQTGTATDKDKRVLWSRKIFPPCKFEAAPNRFDIMPGHKWDGVDRSNGFENRFLDQSNTQKANKENFYKWASKEM